MQYTAQLEVRKVKCKKTEVLNLHLSRDTFDAAGASWCGRPQMSVKIGGRKERKRRKAVLQKVVKCITTSGVQYVTFSCTQTHGSNSKTCIVLVIQ
jgi:hypothetical protein